MDQSNVVKSWAKIDSYMENDYFKLMLWKVVLRLPSHVVHFNILLPMTFNFSLENTSVVYLS